MPRCVRCGRTVARRADSAPAWPWRETIRKSPQSENRRERRKSKRVQRASDCSSWASVPKGRSCIQGGAKPPRAAPPSLASLSSPHDAPARLCSVVPPNEVPHLREQGALGDHSGPEQAGSARVRAAARLTPAGSSCPCCLQTGPITAWSATKQARGEEKFCSAACAHLPS